MAMISYKLFILASMAMLLIAPSLAQHSSYVKGIDVSCYQGNIDWTKVSGISFAYIRATQGVGPSPGTCKTDAHDNKFEENVEGAISANLRIGAYHVAIPNSNNAADEAKWFVSIARNYIRPGNLPPALDLERDVGTMKNPDLAVWINTWMDTVKSLTDVEPIIYTGPNYITNHLADQSSLNRYDLWNANYPATIITPTIIKPWTTWAFWQYTDKGSIPGITVPVDLDYFNGDYSELSKYIIRGNGGTSTTSDNIPPTGTGIITGFKWVGKDADKVGEWDNGMPDGHMDGHFVLTLNLPLPTDIKSILIYSADASGNPSGGQFWTTADKSHWILGVFNKGTQLNKNHVPSLGIYSWQVQFDLYADDSGWFRPGNWFGLEVNLGNLQKLIMIPLA